MDINLRINELVFQPGAEVSALDLKQSNFRSPGLWDRIVNRLPKGQAVYHAKNCTVDCFDNRLSLFPCTHDYLNQDRRWQTQASLLLVNGRLQKVEFHVVDGMYAAQNFLEKFKSICNECFGDPRQEQKNLYQWENDRLSFSGFLHADHVTADFSIECLDE